MSNPSSAKSNPNPKNQLGSQLGNAIATMNRRIAQAQIPKGQSRMGKGKSPKKAKTPSNIGVLVPTMMTLSKGQVVCPRCGEVYDFDKPILECKECGLKMGNKVQDEIDWTKEMKEPFPDFVTNALSPEDVFAKTLKWYFHKWIEPYKKNPTHRIGKI